MKPRIIVCGLGRTGYKVFNLLRQQGAAVVGISDRPIPGEGDDVVVGDLRSAATLMAAGIQDAHTLVLTGADDALNLAILVQARLLEPNIRIVNRLFNIRLGDRVDRTLDDHVTMSVSSIAAPAFAFAAAGSQAIGHLSLFNQTWPMYEEYIDRHHPWFGRPLRELWDDRDRMLIYYIPAIGETDLVSAIINDRALQLGDRMIVATKPSLYSRHNSLLDRLRRFINSLRYFQRQGKSSIAVFLTLLTTIFISTLVYTSVQLNISFVDALYFSVGMITGAGGKEEVAEKSADWIKIFTATMMLIGAGVVGICYALLNDFVLGTRFQKLLQSTPIPQRHHYIICGLGGIGIQTARQLLENGCEVVVIERDPNCRFINTARSLKIPIILGDANLSSTLESANIRRCEALLALTSDDTTNVEIALTAKGSIPSLRVVVRNQDPHFAIMVQQVFKFNSVLSPAELAAPSFAAAAIGGRIFGNGMTAGSLWVALATTVTSEHPFCDRRVRDIAMKSDFVPLYAKRNGELVRGWDLFQLHLLAGDILYLTIPATRLEQLWRTAPPKAMAS